MYITYSTFVKQCLFLSKKKTLISYIYGDWRERESERENQFGSLKLGQFNIERDRG